VAQVAVRLLVVDDPLAVLSVETLEEVKVQLRF
jgi:hypothetical protein